MATQTAPVLEHNDILLHPASTAKQTFYDWNGLNVNIFKAVHSIQGKTYDNIMLMITHTGSHHLFPYYMAALLVGVLLAFAWRSLSNRGGNKHFIHMWIGIFAVLIVAFILQGFIVGPMKDHFAYPRPYIALEHVDGLDRKPDGTDDYHSFPSGHATFITLMILSLWPALSSGKRLLGFGYILLVCWSRMALGMHFPADLLAGFCIASCTVIITRAMLYPILRNWFGLTC